MFFRIGLDQHLRALCPYHFQRAITYAMEKGRFNSDRCVPLNDGLDEWLVMKIMYI